MLKSYMLKSGMISAALLVVTVFYIVRQRQLHKEAGSLAGSSSFANILFIVAILIICMFAWNFIKCIRDMKAEAQKVHINSGYRVSVYHKASWVSPSRYRLNTDQGVYFISYEDYSTLRQYQNAKQPALNLTVHVNTKIAEAIEK